MSRILSTGSSDGLGQQAAHLLIGVGHDVVLHAKSGRFWASQKTAVPERRTLTHGYEIIIREPVNEWPSLGRRAIMSVCLPH